MIFRYSNKAKHSDVKNAASLCFLPPVFAALGYICAACIPVVEAQNLVIDQTLYWQVVPDEEEARFRTGMLNSSALTEAVLPFNPEEDFGPRHIHTLPYQLMPPYTRGNEDHRMVAEAARALADTAAGIAADDPYIGDPNRALHVRRRKL